jgi:hypothetical protein
MTKKEFHDRLLVRGSWGYMTREVDNNPYQIHIWIDVKKASFEEALRLLAHEIGHCQAPFHDVRKEEMKAGLYEKVTLSAYKLVSDMFSKDTKYTADN